MDPTIGFKTFVNIIINSFILKWEIPIYKIWSIMQYPRVVKVIMRVVYSLLQLHGFYLCEISIYAVYLFVPIPPFTR